MREISVVLRDDNPEAGIASKCFKNFSVLIFYEVYDNRLLKQENRQIMLGCCKIMDWHMNLWNQHITNQNYEYMRSSKGYNNIIVVDS